MELVVAVVALPSPQHALALVWCDFTSCGMMSVSVVTPDLPTCSGQSRLLQVELETLWHCESLRNAVIAAQHLLGSRPDVKLLVLAAWLPVLSSIGGNDDLLALLPTAIELGVLTPVVPHSCAIAWIGNTFAVVAPAVAAPTCPVAALPHAVDTLASCQGPCLDIAGRGKASTHAVVLGYPAVAVLLHGDWLWLGTLPLVVMVRLRWLAIVGP